MIRIKIELDQYGLGEEIKTLKTVHIWNDATGTSSRGNYQYRIFNATGTVHRMGEIKGFARKSNNVLKLLGLVMKDAGY